VDGATGVPRGPSPVLDSLWEYAGEMRLPIISANGTTASRVLLVLTLPSLRILVGQGQTASPYAADNDLEGTKFPVLPAAQAGPLSGDLSFPLLFFQFLTSRSVR
jgi:hypothetical protein